MSEGRHRKGRPFSVLAEYRRLAHFPICPLEIPSNGTNYGCEVKRAIRRALYFISSKMVGGLRSDLNFPPETGTDQEDRGFSIPRADLAHPVKRT